MGTQIPSRSFCSIGPVANPSSRCASRIFPGYDRATDLVTALNEEGEEKRKKEEDGEEEGK